MPHRYLEEIAVADVAFEAWGVELSALFTAAADALLGVMVDDPSEILPACVQPLALEADSAEELLFVFLGELVFLKDSRQLLLRVPEPVVAQEGQVWRLTALARGETIDRQRHRLGVDVKAITLHCFALTQEGERWSATVVVDI